MDLVEIRKKSKKKLSKKQTDAPSETPAAGSEAGQSPVSKAPDQDQTQANSNGSVPVKSKPVPSAPSISAAEQNRSALDVLDALFATSPDLTLATEEIYLQGLEKDEVETEGRQQWLTFSLDNEQYAIDIVFVREIIKPREITDIHGCRHLFSA